MSRRPWCLGILSLALTVGCGSSGGDEPAENNGANNSSTVNNGSGANNTSPNNTSNPGGAGCEGAEGDKAVAADNDTGVSLPAGRTCLEAAFTKVLQSPNGEVVPAGMVGDSDGNVYFTGRTKGFFDTIGGDIFVAQVKADGSLGWFKTFGGAKKDGFGKDGVYDPSSGTQHMIAIDASGDLYVAANYNDDDNGILLKLGTDGAAQWATSVQTDLPGNRHPFHAVSVRDGVAHVAGEKGLYAFDAASGDLLGTLAVTVPGGVKGRLLAVHATAAGVFTGGWGGWSGDDDGILMNASFDGAAYTVSWHKRVPLGRGSKVAGIDTGADGSVYVGVNVAGAANVSSELQKWSADGSLTWVRRYGDSERTKTNMIRVVGDQVVVAGQTHLGGSATFTDPLGDGMLLLVNADGSLAADYFYFTGTNPASIDSVKGVWASGSDLHVVWAHAKSANYGEWRNAADYDVLERNFQEVAASEYLLRDTDLEFGTHDDIETSVPTDDWQDVTANVDVVDAAAGAENRPADTDAAYYATLKGLL